MSQAHQLAREEVIYHQTPAWKGAVARRTLLIILAGVLCLTTLVVPSSAEPPPDIARILKARKLVVSMHAKDAPPFFMTDQAGRLYGLETEIAFDLARKLGVDVCFQRNAQTYDEVVRKVEKHEADVAISVLSRTTKRAISVSFSQPYIVLHHALLLNRRKTEKLANGTKLADWLNSSSVAIGTVKGSSFVEFAQHDYPSAQVVQFASLEAAADAVRRGEIHAALYDDSAIQDWVFEHAEDVIYVQAKVRHDRVDPVAMAVNCADAHLLQWINVYLDSIQRDGTLDKLVAIYLKSNDWKEVANR